MPTIVMSLLVWSGTAQFAMVSVIATGGSSALATGTGLLANARFVPMGFALAPSVRGAWWRRLLTGGLLADASFVIGSRGDGGFDVSAVRWASPLQYLAWNVGTAFGALNTGLIGNPNRFGLDVLFPVFYLSILLPELRPPRNEKYDTTRADDDVPWRGLQSRLRLRPVVAAVLAVVVVVVLTPAAPPGVPVVAAAAAALIGLARPRNDVANVRPAGR